MSTNRNAKTTVKRPACRAPERSICRKTGAIEGGTVRVTFDRNIRGELTDGWAFRTVGDQPELLPGFVVCEFKFRVALPAMLKEIVESFTLTPANVSKYRRFCRAIGLAGASANGNDDGGAGNG